MMMLVRPSKASVIQTEPLFNLGLAHVSGLGEPKLGHSLAPTATGLTVLYCTDNQELGKNDDNE